MAKDIEIKRNPHREICSLCNEVSRVGFYVSDEIWQAAMHRHDWNSIVCLRCFTRLADERGVQWDVGDDIKFFPVSWITHKQSVKELAFESERPLPIGLCNITYQSLLDKEKEQEDELS